jgi:hypothetical protein
VRMWMVDPKVMCTQHLLGEHVECHMFVGTILKGTQLTGYLDNRLLETHNLRARHDELADEMTRRGMNHKSPLLDFEIEPKGLVCRDKSLKDLLSRCERCGGENC